MSGKNLQLLGLERSPAWQPDIHELISALKSEIGKGLEVYSKDELQKLETKLAYYEMTLVRLNSP